MAPRAARDSEPDTVKALRTIRWRLSHALWYLRWRILLGVSEKRVIHGIRVRATFHPDADTVTPPLDLVEAALNLIAKFDPRRLRRMQRDLNWILITRTTYAVAYFKPNLKMCVIGWQYLTAPGRNPGSVAATIVHEAMHARLFACKIPYDEPLRPRVEAVCRAAEADFARRFPGGEELAQLILQHEPAPEAFSTATLDRRARESRQAEYEAELKDLEGAELPGWITRWLSRLVRSRAARDARRAAPK